MILPLYVYGQGPLFVKISIPLYKKLFNDLILDTMTPDSSFAKLVQDSQFSISPKLRIKHTSQTQDKKEIIVKMISSKHLVNKIVNGSECLSVYMNSVDFDYMNQSEYLVFETDTA